MRPTRFYSNKQEKQVAKAVGGRKTANSGATPFVKCIDIFFMLIYTNSGATDL